MGGWELGRVTMESKIQAVLAGRHPEELKVVELNSLPTNDAFWRQNGCSNFLDKLVIKVL